MDAIDFFLVRYERVHRMFSDRAIKQITAAQMRARPHPGVNTIAWLLWHMARVEDVGVNRFAADRPGSRHSDKPTEDRMRHARSLGRSMAMALALTLLAGCASVPPVTSIEPLVGNWAGILDRGGPLVPFYLTVNPNQTIVATWALNWANGRITIANGQATYQMTPPLLEGTIRFYPGNGKPTIYMDDLFESFHAVVHPQ